MWTYDSGSGEFHYPNGTLACSGYSGHGDGVNNPFLEDDPDVGPIPLGRYVIGEFLHSPKSGPMTAQLTPVAGTDDYGRSGFEIHGDEIGHVGQELASHGCIILPLQIREAIAASCDTDLEVVCASCCDSSGD